MTEQLTEISIKQVHRWGACYQHSGEKYSRANLRQLIGGDSIPVLSVLDLPIPAEDRLWVLLRPEVIPERALHLLACDFAEHVQPPDADPASLEAIRVKRLWVDGQATDEQLKVARIAAWDVVTGWHGRGTGDTGFDWTPHLVLTAQRRRDAARAAAVAADEAAVIAADEAADDAASAAAVIAADGAAAEAEWQLEQVRAVLMKAS